MNDPGLMLHDAPVCVTGGAGFIGSHLCDALIAAGARVTVIDDLSTGLEANLSDAGDRVRLVHGSILDSETLATAVVGARVVFHLAAVASVPRSVSEPRLYLETNALGTLAVLEAARLAGVERLVYAASSSTYGDQPGLPRVETMPPDVRSPYAASKYTGEQLVLSYARCYAISTVSLRYFNIFGPRQRPDSAYAAAVPRFARAFNDGERPVIYGDGRQTRDFTHVTNAVQANLLAAATPRRLAGEVVNIACGRGTSVLELVDAIAKEFDVPAVAEHAPARLGDVRDSRASIDAARALIGYEPVTPFEVGLRETIAWYRRRWQD